MQRVCFQLRVKPELMDAYRGRHAAVRPEMLREIQASGRRNYSLFLAEDGLLIGYYETNSPEVGNAYLAASEIAAEWEAEMAPFFQSLAGRPDQGAEPLIEIFNLQQQLAFAETTDKGNAS